MKSFYDVQPKIKQWTKIIVPQVIERTKDSSKEQMHWKDLTEPKTPSIISPYSILFPVKNCFPVVEAGVRAVHPALQILSAVESTSHEWTRVYLVSGFFSCRVQSVFSDHKVGALLFWSQFLVKSSFFINASCIRLHQWIDQLQRRNSLLVCWSVHQFVVVIRQ